MAEEAQRDSGGSEMRIFWAAPEGGDKHPAVLVAIHGGGMDGFSARIVEQLAEAGYTAAAPDIFHRMAGLTDRGEIMARLNDADILADIAAGVEFLEETGRADMGRLAILGHCMGGRHAFLGASADPRFKAAVVYYGGNMFRTWGDRPGPTPFERLGALEAHVIGFFGNDDRNPSPEDVDRIEAELARLGVAHEFHRYDGAGHAFQDFRTERYREAATKESWARTITFLNETLGA